MEILTTDHDGDGLPDAWEIAQFGDLRYSGEDDPDNDGLSNFLEYHFAADPLSVDSNGDGISVLAQGMLRLNFDPATTPLPSSSKAAPT